MAASVSVVPVQSGRLPNRANNYFVMNPDTAKVSRAARGGEDRLIMTFHGESFNVSPKRLETIFDCVTQSELDPTKLVKRDIESGELTMNVVFCEQRGAGPSKVFFMSGDQASVAKITRNPFSRERSLFQMQVDESEVKGCITLVNKREYARSGIVEEQAGRGEDIQAAMPVLAVRRARASREREGVEKAIRRCVVLCCLLGGVYLVGLWASRD